MPSLQSLSNKSKKNKKATKIQSIFRGRKIRRKLQKAKIETEAKRLFVKVNKSKAKQALIDMARNTDKESIEYMACELFNDLEKDDPEKYAWWIEKAKQNLLKPNKTNANKKENETSKQKVNYKRCPNGTRRNKITGLCEKQ
ncbi:hypothetical protein [Chrysochromulina parva virus BQ2]|uniref:Uncharacterized protein n=1 Tax=Chrysochromulina parva virus BQ2 TaxID=3070831 RepID=A0A4Y6GSA0_9VIRU|nr:hypothetical protein QKE47_gp14 [Chrysochromulina parva virus]QDF45905.1 hypothetical protein [Chrysochromulina parva virus BQ2]